VRERDVEIRKQRVEGLILTYLARNPTAEDTVDGILEWWLMNEEIRFRMQEVEAALVELTDRGIITQTIGEDSRARYRISPKKSDQG
jgi:hypothetical protein